MISICIPYIRPQNMEKLIARIHETAGISDYEILVEEDTARIGCPKMLKRLVEKSTGDKICFIGDDTFPEPNWLKNAVDAMGALPDGWGVVGINSQASRHAAHFLADKRMLALLPDGEFFNTAYKHCWCDNELTDIASENNRFVFCDEAVLNHSHPIFGTAVPCGDYNRVYSEEYRKHDLLMYQKRKRARYGFKLGIGFPVIDSKVYLQFMVSFLALESPAYTLLLPTFQVGEFPKDIAAVRNNLVEQALYEGCTHLLMLDTDQIYRTSDMIPRLLAHNVSVVSAPVHRRYPPFDNIILRGKVGEFYSVPEEEAYSGKLLKADATGTGCILYSMEVFNIVPPPWFELTVSDSGSSVGEDINLCMKLGREGIPIYVDTSIDIGHLSLYEVNRGTRRLFKALNGLK